MNISKFQFILRLTLLIMVTLISDGSGGHTEEHAQDEQLLDKCHRSRGKLEWLWSQRSFCRIMCPRGMGVADTSDYIQVREILLETAGCLKLEAEMLACFCSMRRPGTFILHAFRLNFFASAFNGAIYQLKSASGNCGDHETLIIRARIVGENATSSEHNPFGLWGIDRIFTTSNDIRAKWRQWNADRLTGKISDSSNDSGELLRLESEDQTAIRANDFLISDDGYEIDWDGERWNDDDETEDSSEESSEEDVWYDADTGAQDEENWYDAEDEDDTDDSDDNYDRAENDLAWQLMDDIFGGSDDTSTDDEMSDFDIDVYVV